MRRWLTSLTLLMVVSLVTGCGAAATAPGQPQAGHGLPPTSTPKAATPVTLVLDWTPNADHAGIYTALAKGYYSAAGLDVKIEIPSDSTNAVEQVAAGKSQFAISYETETLFARARQVPVIAVAALVQKPLNSLIALKQSGIVRPGDLKGKKVGVAGLPADEPLLSSLLKADGLTLKDVTVVNVGYDLVPALLSRKVDAILGGYWNWEALQLPRKGAPVNVIHLEKWGVPTYNELVVVTSEQMAARQPGVVRAFVTATARGYLEAMAHPEEAVAAVLKADTTLDQGLVRQSLAALAPVFVADAPRFGYMDPSAWQAYQDWLIKEKLLQQAVDVQRAMTNRFTEGVGR